jgi:hypothetical protein
LTDDYKDFTAGVEKCLKRGGKEAREEKLESSVSRTASLRLDSIT